MNVCVHVCIAPDLYSVLSVFKDLSFIFRAWYLDIKIWAVCMEYLPKLQERICLSFHNYFFHSLYISIELWTCTLCFGLQCNAIITQVHPLLRICAFGALPAGCCAQWRVTNLQKTGEQWFGG